jgi:hypothetical protein
MIIIILKMLETRKVLKKKALHTFIFSVFNTSFVQACSFDNVLALFYFKLMAYDRRKKIK